MDSGVFDFVREAGPDSCASWQGLLAGRDPLQSQSVVHERLHPEQSWWPRHRECSLRLGNSCKNFCGSTRIVRSSTLVVPDTGDSNRSRARLYRMRLRDADRSSGKSARDASRESTWSTLCPKSPMFTNHETQLGMRGEIWCSQSAVAWFLVTRVYRLFQIELNRKHCVGN